MLVVVSVTLVRLPVCMLILDLILRLELVYQFGLLLVLQFRKLDLDTAGSWRCLLLSNTVDIHFDLCLNTTSY